MADQSPHCDDASDRDFYAEGADVAIAGQSGLVPGDVVDCGVDAEAAWLDGYQHTLAGLGAVE